MKPVAYLQTILLSFAGLLLLHSLAFVYQLGARVPASYWAREAKIIKDHLLTEAKGRRLIVIAGSSGFFGFESSLIEKHLGLTPVNYSLHNQWPLEYYFSAIAPHLRAGDVILLAPEYEYYLRTTPYTSLYVSDMMTFEEDGFWKLALREKARFMASVPLERIIIGAIAKLFAERLKNDPLKSAAEVLSLWTEPPTPAFQPGGYSFRYLNKYGDFSLSFLNSYTGRAWYAVARPFTYSAYTWSVIAEFQQWCRAHGVALYASWPPSIKDPLMEFDAPRVRTHVNALIANYREIGVPVLGRPEDFQFDRKWFGDNRYHLMQEGRIERTRRVALFLADALEASPSSAPSQP